MHLECLDKSEPDVNVITSDFGNPDGTTIWLPLRPRLKTGSVLQPAQDLPSHLQSSSCGKRHKA
jgi:hypothetical protein